MRHSVRKFFAATIMVCSSTISFASDNSATVFPAEGNVQCNDYASNRAIFQMGTNSPQTSGIVLGVDNPQDADTTAESASYAIQGGTVASFTASTTPIDFAILKSNSKISLIIYPSGGVRADGNMTVTVAGTPQPITAMSLCYGLGNTAPVTHRSTIKSCNISSLLDQTGVTCPATGRTLVCNFELDKSFYGLNNGSDSCCVCNNPDGELKECDPNVAAGQPNACTQTTPKTNTEVTTHIELNNDPYYCTTVGGVRRRRQE